MSCPRTPTLTGLETRTKYHDQRHQIFTSTPAKTVSKDRGGSKWFAEESVWTPASGVYIKVQKGQHKFQASGRWAKTDPLSYHRGQHQQRPRAQRDVTTSGAETFTTVSQRAVNANSGARVVTAKGWMERPVFTEAAQRRQVMSVETSVYPPCVLYKAKKFTVDWVNNKPSRSLDMLQFSASEPQVCGTVSLSDGTSFRIKEPMEECLVTLNTVSSPPTLAFSGGVHVVRWLPGKQSASNSFDKLAVVSVDASCGGEVHLSDGSAFENPVDADALRRLKGRIKDAKRTSASSCDGSYGLLSGSGSPDPETVMSILGLAARERDGDDEVVVAPDFGPEHLLWGATPLGSLVQGTRYVFSLPLSFSV